jgi:glutathione S-transferase
MISYSLKYFNREGKIELARLIFAAANTKYTEMCVENLTDSDTRLGLIPYLEVDNTKITLVSVICRYLAREFGFSGKNNLEQAKCDSIAQMCMLLIDTYYRLVFNVESVDQKKLGLKQFEDEEMEKAAQTIECLIEMHSGASKSQESQYCVGGSLSYADLFVYEMVATYFPRDKNYKSFFERFPRIYRVHANVEKDKLVSSYIKNRASVGHIQSEIV